MTPPAVGETASGEPVKEQSIWENAEVCCYLTRSGLLIVDVIQPVMLQLVQNDL